MNRRDGTGVLRRDARHHAGTVHPEPGQLPQIRLQASATAAVRAGDRERRGLAWPRRHQIVNTSKRNVANGFPPLKRAWWLKINELSAYTTIHGVRNNAKYMCVRRMSLLQAIFSMLDSGP